MLRSIRAWWDEPALAPPKRPSRTDGALAVALLALSATEGLLRDDLPARGLALALPVAVAVVIAGAVALRRTRPFGAFAVAFGAILAVSATELALGLAPAALYASTAALLLPYSLFRAGSGRQAALGLAVMACAYALSARQGELRDFGEAMAAATVLLLPAALGAVARTREQARRRELDHARLRERERLARELHDTVGHHLAAVAIQAQAGRAVAATRPEAALGALEAIEGEAARALRELRALVGALRDEDDAALGPPAGLAALEALGRGAGVEVVLEGELDGLRPSLEAALHRIAQESITNALRHARRARRIRVRVVGDARVVRLTVEDDGEAPAHAAPGFGLTGMAERAALLGGTFEAGPAPDGGWVVRATLPRDGDTR
ncbi:MAG: sensor histidine kinase [Sandaracinaceae bacterium]|nr:sensor histidine kinase [Sandaracinaceae bacterium]